MERSSLYKFIDSVGSFKSLPARNIKNLYLPLCNENLMSSVSPALHGDIKKNQNTFLLQPVSRVDLSLLKASRNFWVHLDNGNVWSAAGVSRDFKTIAQDEFLLEAGLLWQRISRKNKKIGLESSILSFIPPDEPVEIMQVTLSNITSKKIELTPFAAIPLYCRSAENIRDHRHVTSLLCRVFLELYGIKVKPTLLFDESGHHPNKTVYFAAACDQNSKPARYIYPTQEIFCGEGDLEFPEAVLKNQPPKKLSVQGKEPMAAFAFDKINLAAGKSKTFIVVLGISSGDFDLSNFFRKFNSTEKINFLFEKTKTFWQEKSGSLETKTGSAQFDNWLRWVNLQPALRRIFGCSFLPDFDYGKGGRGWRDLWQDCLGLILSDPASVRDLLINNFCGVKIDGSNATIIGKEPGEFIADRNNISRVWMDHGVWPLITLDLYIQETGDMGILFEETTYFRNHEINRSEKIDFSWAPAYGNRLKTASGKIYKSSILEHLLVQNLVQFYNVGSHNQVRLEGADWNDGLDMAKENGESVAFSSMYAQNLFRLAELIKIYAKKEIELAEEIKILLSDFNCSSINKKHRILEDYFARTACKVSGKKIRINTQALAVNLEKKSSWMKKHIRKNEWLSQGFFNGYYDNRKQRVDGKKGKLTRMTLASQVFPIMSQTADREKTKKILSNIYRYLFDRSVGGIRLNTDFKEEQHDLGRAFSFSYGDKENGAVFSHMVVMLAYALYKQGFSVEGWKVLNSLYELAVNTEKSKIYPCLPEYFDLSGRGMYSYLTGSASWFMLTLLTQAFGIKGQNGDLLIEPKLTKEQFKFTDKVSISRIFADRKLKIIFFNPQAKEAGVYKIKRFLLNSESFPIEESFRVVISREVILCLPKDKVNVIEVSLG